MFNHKFKASLLHFLISLLLVILIIGSMLFFFFPSIYFSVTDFKELAYIIITVDLILGPLLTFIIFNPDKAKSALYLDFSVVGAVQLSALIYGAYTLYQVHPVYITFNVDRFTVVSAKDAQPKKAKFKEYKISKLSAGKLAFAKNPEDEKLQDQILLDAIQGGEDLDQREEFYEPYLDNLSTIVEKSINPSLIFSDKNKEINSVKKLLNSGTKLDSLAFLPINSTNKEAIIVLNKKTGEPISTLQIDPWKLSER